MGLGLVALVLGLLVIRAIPASPVSSVIQPEVLIPGLYLNDCLLQPRTMLYRSETTGGRGREPTFFLSLPLHNVSAAACLSSIGDSMTPSSLGSTKASSPGVEPLSPVAFL